MLNVVSNLANVLSVGQSMRRRWSIPPDVDRILKTQRGFTLIELLVVITIIIVLISLLTPALDRALYQGKLAQCSGVFKALAQNMSIYAFDHQRYYPHRPIFVRDEVNRLRMGEPYGAQRRGTAVQRARGIAVIDWRPILKGYVPFDLFNDPLTEEIDFSMENTEEHINVYSSQAIFVGFEYYYPNSGEDAMKRVGDRWSYNGKSFNYMATDYMHMLEANPRVRSSHPDSADIMYNASSQNAQNGTDLTFYWTASGWWTFRTAQRGLVDMNCAGADGSVLRFANLTWDDERFWYVSQLGYTGWSSQHTPLIGLQIPK